MTSTERKLNHPEGVTEVVSHTPNPPTAIRTNVIRSLPPPQPPPTNIAPSHHYPHHHSHHHHHHHRHHHDQPSPVCDTFKRPHHPHPQPNPPINLDNPYFRKKPILFSLLTGNTIVPSNTLNTESQPQAAAAAAVSTTPAIPVSTHSNQSNSLSGPELEGCSNNSSSSAPKVLPHQRYRQFFLCSKFDSESVSNPSQSPSSCSERSQFCSHSTHRSNCRFNRKSPEESRKSCPAGNNKPRFHHHVSGQVKDDFIKTIGEVNRAKIAQESQASKPVSVPEAKQVSKESLPPAPTPPLQVPSRLETLLVTPKIVKLIETDKPPPIGQNNIPTPMTNSPIQKSSSIASVLNSHETNNNAPNVPKSHHPQPHLQPPPTNFPVHSQLPLRTSLPIGQQIASRFGGPMNGPIRFFPSNYGPPTIENIQSVNFGRGPPFRGGGCSRFGNGRFPSFDMFPRAPFDIRQSISAHIQNRLHARANFMMNNNNNNNNNNNVRMSHAFDNPLLDRFAGLGPFQNVRQPVHVSNNQFQNRQQPSTVPLNPAQHQMPNIPLSQALNRPNNFPTPSSNLSLRTILETDIVLNQKSNILQKNPQPSVPNVHNQPRIINDSTNRKSSNDNRNETSIHRSRKRARLDPNSKSLDLERPGTAFSTHSEPSVGEERAKRQLPEIEVIEIDDDSPVPEVQVDEEEEDPCDLDTPELIIDENHPEAEPDLDVPKFDEINSTETNTDKSNTEKPEISSREADNLGSDKSEEALIEKQNSETPELAEPVLSENSIDETSNPEDEEDEDSKKPEDSLDLVTEKLVPESVSELSKQVSDNQIEPEKPDKFNPPDTEPAEPEPEDNSPKPIINLSEMTPAAIEKLDHTLRLGNVIDMIFSNAFVPANPRAKRSEAEQQLTTLIVPTESAIRSNSGSETEIEVIESE